MRILQIIYYYRNFIAIFVNNLQKKQKLKEPLVIPRVQGSLTLPLIAYACLWYFAILNR
jgi:hypothetical protein